VEKKVLHILIVDDSPDDADLPSAVLRSAGYMLKSQRVQDTAGMQAALQKGDWDVVISKPTLAHFGAYLALDALKRAQLDVPLIVFADKISDEELAKAMRAGARDVVRRNDLGRLVPAIERELTAVHERHEYVTASARLKEIQNKHEAMINSAREAICYSHDGMHVDVNRAYLSLFGYGDLAELEGVPVLDLIEPEDHARFKEFLRKASKNANKSMDPQQFMAVRKDGSKLPIEVSLSLINLGGEGCTQMVVSDLTKRPAPPAAIEDSQNERDAVTGAYGKDYFLSELGKAVEKAKSRVANSLLLYIELDGLKEVNEELGKEVGDRLLHDVSERFMRALGEHAMLSRFGIDEFAALVHDVEHRDPQQLAIRLKQCVAEAALRAGAQAHAASCALGHIVIEETAGSVEQVLSWAYSACEQARKQKKVTTAPVAAAPAPKEKRAGATDAEARRLNQWRERIQQALERGGFQLHYQPVINLIGDPSEYYEVLIRLPGEDDQLIPAAKFMPVAERSGQAQAIDQWVLRHAVSGLADLHREDQNASFFINLSPQAVQDEIITLTIREALKNNNLQGRFLILEIDETLLDSSPKEAGVFVNAVHKLGCRISLDNFLARLTCLDRLRELPIEFVKIDGTVARDAAHDNIKQMMLKTIVQTAKLLNKKTIGKCVEDEETLSLLYSYELDYLQGNYFQHADARPEYAFAGETTLSSDMETPGWPPSS
jgi:diguanylate cyclase (GGDEF)-like protein/PAS domain S-box-containing protein